MQFEMATVPSPPSEIAPPTEAEFPIIAQFVNDVVTLTGPSWENFTPTGPGVRRDKLYIRNIPPFITAKLNRN